MVLKSNQLFRNFLLVDTSCWPLESKLNFMYTNNLLINQTFVARLLAPFSKAFLNFPGAQKGFHLQDHPHAEP